VELPGAVVVVTGASSGIGWATAWAFAREGSALVVSARREDRLRELSGEIEERGGRVLPVRCDVSDFAQVEALQKTVEAEFGRCDVLVNNAGVPGGGAFAEMAVDQIERITRVNYLGVLYCAKAFLPMMLQAGQGHIVNVASLAGRIATPGASVYSATKHAVVAFSEALHYEVADRGVLVTSFNPGFTATEGFPQKDRSRRIVMKPEQVAGGIVEVVKSGTAPERSMPRWLASLQAVRVLAPPLYRFGLKQVARRGLRPTRAQDP
jgi:uncharacterized protein